MFDFLKTILPSGADDADDEVDSQLALGALMVEAALQDDQYDSGEKAAIERVLRAEFDLSEKEAITLREKAETAQADSVGLFRFTQAVKEGWPIEERVAVIERLWEIALSDGARDPAEDALIRQICGLIGVQDRDSGLARQRVAARQ